MFKKLFSFKNKFHLVFNSPKANYTQKKYSTHYHHNSSLFFGNQHHFPLTIYCTKSRIGYNISKMSKSSYSSVTKGVKSEDSNLKVKNEGHELTSESTTRTCIPEKPQAECSSPALGKEKQEDSNQSFDVASTMPPKPHSMFGYPSVSRNSDVGSPPLKKSFSEGRRKETTFKEDFKHLQNMSVDEKRGHYKCAKYIPLQDVVPWSTDAKRILAKSAVTSRDKELVKETFSVDPELNSKVALFTGDITALEIDCIVNAANSSLLGGGGVDGAIHRAAGPSLVKQCRTLGGCDIGDAKITHGYFLPSQYVIHTVGPMDGNPRLLEGSYLRSMDVALENEVRSIAFPCIATGVYGFPNDKAAKIALTTIRKFLEDKRDKFDLVIFCLFMQKDIKLYEKLIQLVFPVDKSN